MLNNPNTLETYIKIYYSTGWLGFVLCFTFNISFIILAIVDVVLGCKFSNKELMDEARRVFYYNKLKAYEE